MSFPIILNMHNKVVANSFSGSRASQNIVNSHLVWKRFYNLRLPECVKCTQAELAPDKIQIDIFAQQFN